MKLSRLEAVRFGRLEDVSLGEFGDGLSVVLGPNGAGKTSFTTLARYVLYGYPKRSESEPGYESAAGKRLGRLVFADATGEWIAERTEGVKGGLLTVQTVGGAKRDDLVEQITQGVSSNEFRVVFGFGLKDMAEIAAGSDGSGVMSRLYAARVGLDVSPQDVREDIEGSAAELFKPGRATSPVINSALREIKNLKKDIQDLGRAADKYAEKRKRLTMMREELEALRQLRDETVKRRTELEAYAHQLESIEDAIAEYESELREIQAERTSLEAQIESITLDEELLDAGPQLTAVIDRLPAYGEWLPNIERTESKADERQKAARQALERVAVDEGIAAAVDRGPETFAGVQQHRGILDRAQIRVESATHAYEDARSQATVEARGRAVGREAKGQDGSLKPSLVMGALGLIAIVLGFLLTQYVAVGIGAALVIVALALVLLGRGSMTPKTTTDDFDAAVELAAEQLASAQQALDAARHEWREWARERGLLIVGEDPDAAQLLLNAVEEWHRACDEAEVFRAESRSVCERCEEYRDSLAALLGDRLPSVTSSALVDVPGLVERAKRMLADTMDMRDRRDALISRSEEVGRLKVSLEAELQATRVSRDELRGRLDDPELDSVRLGGLATAAAAQADEVDRAYVDLTERVGELAGKLDEEGKDAEMSRARLELAGWQQRLTEASERYAVYAGAAALIARTQAYHERARQPEVVRRAGEIFAQITQGRYERISIPAGGGEIVAYRGTDSTPSSELSRGSQEQLYLALRIALVEQLDGVGDGLPVLMDDIFANFDAQRHEGAAKAVAELARHRQVVFFTCHPEVAELFAAVDPGHTVLELARC